MSVRGHEVCKQPIGHLGVIKWVNCLAGYGHCTVSFSKECCFVDIVVLGS